MARSRRSSARNRRFDRFQSAADHAAHKLGMSSALHGISIRIRDDEEYNTAVRYGYPSVPMYEIEVDAYTDRGDLPTDWGNKIMSAMMGTVYYHGGHSYSEREVYPLLSTNDKRPVRTIRFTCWHKQDELERRRWLATQTTVTLEKAA